MSDSADRAVFAALATMYNEKKPAVTMVDFLDKQKKRMDPQNYYAAYLSIASSLMVDEKYEEAHSMAHDILLKCKNLSDTDLLKATVVMISSASFYDAHLALQYLCHRDDIITKLGDPLKLFEFDIATCRALMKIRQYKEAHTLLVRLIRYARDNHGNSADITMQLTMWMAILFYNSNKLDKAKPFIEYLFKRRERFSTIQQQTLDEMHATLTSQSKP